MTPGELNLCADVYTEKEREKHKAEVTYAFYSAYFNLKGQKGLSGKDLEAVLKQIEKPEMDDEQLYQKVMAISQKLGGSG